MAATVVVVPDIGDFEDIPVIEILVSPGERVEMEQTLVTLESDKATMDVPAPQAGEVVDVKVSVGDLVSQGSVLLELLVDAGAEDAAPAANPGATPSPDPAGEVTAVAPPPGEHTTPPPREPARPPPPAAARTVHASPAIRRFARTLGVDLTAVAGTGLKGRIQRTDVEAFVKDRLTQAPPQPASSAIAPIPPVDFSRFGPVETQALSRIQRVSGPFLQRAWLNIPHVTYHDEADITELETFRKQLKDDDLTADVRITPLAFFVKVLSAALRAFPIFNASLAPDGASLVLKRYFHIGVAVDTPNGLVVPVMRDVDRLGLIEIAEGLATLSARAREGKLKPGDMQGGCMSISSLGGIGGTGFTPIVNAPEVAILGVARARMTPVWNGAEFVPRLMVPLSLSFDHRVIDGVAGARFMSFLCAQLRDLRKLLL